MRKEELEEATMKYDLSLEKDLLSYKNDYDDDERQEIFKLCRKISRANISESTLKDENVREEVIKPYFLRSLKVLENPRILDYFTNKTQKIKLIRDGKFIEQETELDFDRKTGQPTKFILRLPKGQLTMSEQMGFAHEMGHVPLIDKPREDFLEYSEALPIYMEYLTALRKQKDRGKALDYFLTERLPMEYEEAKDIMKIFKRIENKDTIIRLYHTQLFADYYKYLESLEFALALIDRMDSDLPAVSDEVEKVITGTSLANMADNLDITTDGCERLLKEYKRMSR